MGIVVKVFRCGDGPKNKLDHASLESSANVWEAISQTAATATTFPQSALWRAIDPNLPEKSSAVKVAVQAHCVALLDLGPLTKWCRLALTVAKGAHALFLAATAGWDDKAAAYEPFRLVGNRSEVIVTEAAREAWDAALDAHTQLLAREDFGALTPARVGGLFLLTHTPDNWVKVTESFGFDYWWLRVMHLSIERNVNLKIGDFALAGPRARDRSEAALEIAQRQIATIVALKVAIFYKKRHGENAQPLRVTRHDLEQAKRKWLQRPQAQKKRPRTEGVAGVVSAAMGAASLAELRPVRGVLRLASEERGALTRRIAALDRLACIGLAWQRVVAEQSAALQTRLMEEVDALARAGEDTEAVRACHTADAVHRRIVEPARGVASTSGLQLDPADSVWASRHASVAKLVAVGAGAPPARAGAPATVVYVRGEGEFKRLFATGGGGGACGHPAMPAAIRAETASLADRLLALLEVELRLRSSTAARCPLPLELRADLAVPHGGEGEGEGVGAPSPPSHHKPPPHVEAYRKAKRQQLAALRHDGVFATAVARSVCHAIHAAFYGCLHLVSSNGNAAADAWRSLTPRRCAALAVVNRMLTIAACFDGLVPPDADADEVAIVAHDAGTQSLALFEDLEPVLARKWPAARALADVAAGCESWLRNPRRIVAADDPAVEALAGPWWIACGPSGLVIAPEHKQAALDRLEDDAASSAWWDAWPPTREQVATRETTATAIRWGGRASPAFLGIEKPQQFLGVPPFHGYAP